MLRKRKKVDREIEFNAFVAMIDVVFLLLLYFIMTYNAIVEESLLYFSPAVSSSNSSSEKTASNDFVVLEITGNSDDSKCLLNGQNVSPARLPEYLTEISQNNPETGIVIFCRDSVKHSTLVDIFDICRKSPLKKISLASNK